VAGNPHKRLIFPVTLGGAAAAHLRFDVWCKACGYRSEPKAIAMRQVIEQGYPLTVP
jgi:hypothetical protein